MCPLCNNKLTASFSSGSTKKYPYYHCQGRCKTRVNARFLNTCYERKLQQLVLSSGVMDLFKSILEDWNTGTQKAEYLQHRNRVVRKLIEQESILSRGRKLFVADVLKADDYNELKREYLVNSKCLQRELNDINIKLEKIDKQNQLAIRSPANIFENLSSLDIADKKHLVNLIPPIKVDFQTGDISLKLNNALAKILLTK